MSDANTQIEKLYRELLDFWNSQDAGGMASFFAMGGSIEGFDEAR